MGRPRKKTDQERVVAYILCQTRRDAKKRGLAFSLTHEEVHQLVTAPCTYCGRMDWRCTYPGGKRASKQVCHAANGIDRLDSNGAYEVGNCVSCCAICNYAKGSMTLEEFHKWLFAVIAFQQAKSRNHVRTARHG